MVGGARPELLGDAEALGSVAKSAIVLSKASGDDLKSSIEAVTTTLGQFKLAGKDSDLVVNQLAAGAKVGAAEIPQITDALKEFGTVAEISNISTSNSIALTEVLADRQLKGAEAGTQLRNVLSKLASADILPKTAQEQFKKLSIDINILKDSSLPLEARLRELGKAQGDVAALTKIFGLENLQAATIITSGIDKYVELDKAIQGTSEAYKQAGINADNAASKIDNIQKGALNSLEQKISDSSTATGILVDSLGFLVNELDVVGFAFDVLSTAILGPLAGIGNFIVQVKELLGLKKDLSKTPSAPVEDFTLADPLFPDFGRKTLAPFDAAPIDINTSAVDKNTESTDKNTESKRKNKEEDLGAADSIARLTKNVTALQDA
ncbi:MAG TPA: phage tail tape measure protein, partial [Candidatus Avimonas sp.]|nr:phage tail tape measure protein [Candidatus Avimonas sp.]